MTERSGKSRVDDFASSRAALVLAFAWGLTEATFFFIVPDVLLTLVACRALRPALKATLASLAGALLGGALMYAFGVHEQHTARVFLDRVPAISPELIERVASQINEGGSLAVLLGPLKGIPYKIFAVEWGARGGSFIEFMLISIPARYVRFLLVVAATRLIARIIEPLTAHRSTIEVTVLAVIWIGFYSFYFAHFGW